MSNSEKPEQERTRIAKEQMLAALESCMGIVTTAADMAGVDRVTHYRWMNSDQSYAEAVAMIQNGALDFAESALLKRINKGDTIAIIFYLKTKGKHRGYTEKIELDGRLVSRNLNVTMNDEEVKQIAQALEDEY